MYELLGLKVERVGLDLKLPNLLVSGRYEEGGRKDDLSGLKPDIGEWRLSTLADCTQANRITAKLASLFIF